MYLSEREGLSCQFVKNNNYKNNANNNNNKNVKNPYQNIYKKTKILPIKEL